MSISDIRDDTNAVPDIALTLYWTIGNRRYATSRFSRILRKSVARLP
jgi:hypothetical protein